MRQGHSNNFSKEQKGENCSVGRQSGIELLGYIFNPDQGMWCGYVKGDPEHQVSGKSFEELQVKLRQVHLDPRPSVSSSVCSNTALICWHWQRRTVPVP